VSYLASLGWNLEQGGWSSCNDGAENQWVWSAMVASLLLVAAVVKAHDCTIVVAAVAVVAARTAIVGVGTADP
jgi:hypothetical protein